MRRRATARIAAVVLAAVVSILVLSGVGYAYWTTRASGSGTATTSTSSALLTLSVTGTATGLYPDGPTSTLTVKLAATGSGSVSLSTITPSAGTDRSGCDAGKALVVQRLDPLPDTVTATSPKTVRYSVAMAHDAADACRGARFTLTFDAEARAG